MKILLDTDVVVAAMRSPLGASAELLRRIEKGNATMLLSVALALEYEARCMLAEHRLAAGHSAAEAAIYIDGLIAMAEPVEMHFRWRPQLHDPGDELVLEAAVKGGASAIVTFNEKDLREARQSFGIDVIRPGEALRRIKSMRTRVATFPLRLPVSLKTALETISDRDGTSVNQFLVVAAAEKIAALQTEEFFLERQKRADKQAFRRILDRKGGEAPRPEDEWSTDKGDGSVKVKTAEGQKTVQRASMSASRTGRRTGGRSR